MDYYDDIKNVKSYIDMAKECDASYLIEKLGLYATEGSSVLEIGMGPGNDLKLLKEKFVATGSDKYQKFVDEYKKFSKDDDVLVLDAVTLDTDRKFGAVYSNKVLMHLTRDEFKKSMDRQSEILNDDGIILHTFWRGEGEETFSGMLNVYYIEEELQKLFSEKFEVLLLESYAEFEEDDSIIVVAKKK